MTAPHRRSGPGPLRVHRPTPDALTGAVWGPSDPLWKRAPTEDANGRMAADFMMLIPKLNRRLPADREACIRTLDLVMRAHDDRIIFADLNLGLNLLWISFRPADGVIADIVDDIQRHVPSALLIANRGQPGRARPRGPRTLWHRVRQRLLPSP